MHRLYTDDTGRVCLDPDGRHYGVPVYLWRAAPVGLATRRQLRAAGLRPGGQDPAAMLLRPRRSRAPLVAYLDRLAQAKPKREATPAQRVAIGKALTARRTCGTCQQVREYFIPRSLGECIDCAPGSSWKEAA
ncbi:MAG: RRQRL motif-containing zinc-binding protein [Micromonosporaceae bacterium]